MNVPPAVVVKKQRGDALHKVRLILLGVVFGVAFAWVTMIGRSPIGAIRPDFHLEHPPPISHKNRNVAAHAQGGDGLRGVHHGAHDHDAHGANHENHGTHHDAEGVNRDDGAQHNVHGANHGAHHGAHHGADDGDHGAKDENYGAHNDAHVEAGHGAYPEGHGKPGMNGDRGDAVTEERRAAVINAMRHAYGGYKRFAWGFDELMPLSKRGRNWHGARLALTLVDALSTLHLMGMHAEFKESVDFLAEQIAFGKRPIHSTVSHFETTIRILGGLLSAYELDGERDPRLLEMAEAVGKMLSRGFDDSRSGLPSTCVNFAMQSCRGSTTSNIAELGTLQLEFGTLAFHTKNANFDIRAQHAYNVLRARCGSEFRGCGLMVSTSSGHVHGRTSLGAMGDSFYEYVLKHFVLTGGTDTRRAADSRVMLHTLRKTIISEKDGLMYTGHPMDELACFTGGMYALAAMWLPVDTEEHKRDRDFFTEVGGKFARTCYEMHKQMASGIAPETAYIGKSGSIRAGASHYLLRPETVETLFYMWRLTKDQKYRDWGWDTFQSIMRHSKVATGGFASLNNVKSDSPSKKDSQESFFLAETLKYYYLLFSPDSALPLNEWVFNTEAHPLRIRRRNTMDLWREYEKANGLEAMWLPPKVAGVPPGAETEGMRKRRIERDQH